MASISKKVPRVSGPTASSFDDTRAVGRDEFASGGDVEAEAQRVRPRQAALDQRAHEPVRRLRDAAATARDRPAFGTKGSTSEPFQRTMSFVAAADFAMLAEGCAGPMQGAADEDSGL
ncbi:hypothetical protein ABID26_006173 [Mesorhizobium shonense]|uniref:Uncharacterized protein n=1 Tax=Mesorhizobium shonense TaxID=1209948 RepID=A0ABV2I1K7_9HYPH